MRFAIAIVSIPLLTLATALGGDDESKASSKPPNQTVLKAAPVDDEREVQALAFVRQHHPELASVLDALKPMNPLEYRKAIDELTQVSRTLAELKSRNPKRYAFALEAWKAKSRVELLAAQLSGSPNEETRSQLKLAIEAKLDVEIRRHRFELEQAELTAKKAREAINRLETNRDSIVEARFRALQPKKTSKAKKTAPAKSAPANTPASVPANPLGEDR